MDTYVILFLLDRVAVLMKWHAIVLHLAMQYKRY